MGNVFVGLSVSLDGFIAGANDGPDNPLGDGGGRLFEWMNAGPERNRSNRFICPPDASLPVVQSWYDDCGAMISGRRLRHRRRLGGRAPDRRTELRHHPRGADRGPVEPAGPVRHRRRRAGRRAGEGGGRRPRRVGLRRQHRPAAAPGRLLDEIELSVAPVLLGSGVRLFEHLGGVVNLEQTRSIPSDRVTHLRYRILR
jgi:hypothetical protein